jgi:hypothetical protein
VTGHIWLPYLRGQLRREQPPALQVACPHCDAAAGRPCTGASGRKLHQEHASREEAAGVRPKVVALGEPGAGS